MKAIERVVEEGQPVTRDLGGKASTTEAAETVAPLLEDLASLRGDLPAASAPVNDRWRRMPAGACPASRGPAASGQRSFELTAVR